MGKGCIYRPGYTVPLPDGTRERRKSPNWWIQYVDGAGVKRRAAVGPDKRQAQDALTMKLRNAIAERNGLPTQSAATLPIRDLVAAYLAAQAPSVTPAHIKSLRQRLETILTKTRAVTVKDLTPERIETALVDLAETPMKNGALPSARTVNVYLQAVKGMLTWAVKRRKLTHNPLDCVQARPELEKRHARRALSENELSRLLAAALEGPAKRATPIYKGGTISLEEQARLAEQGRRNALIYRLLFMTGLRLNEARLLTWGDVDLDAETLTTRPEWRGNKSGRTDTLPLAPALVELLKDWRAGHPGDDRVIQIPGKMLETFDRDLESAGIPKRDGAGRVVDLHSLRHTYGSRLVAAGVDIATAQKLMRHATPSMTLGIYCHSSKARLADAVSVLPDIEPAARPEAAAAIREGTTDAPINSETSPKVEKFGARIVQATGRQNAQGIDNTKVSLPRVSACKAGALAAELIAQASQNSTVQLCKQAQNKELTTPAPLHSENPELCTKPPMINLNCTDSVKEQSKDSQSNLAQENERELPPDLQELAALWPRLPDAVKMGLLATARAVAGQSPPNEKA